MSLRTGTGSAQVNGLPPSGVLAPSPIASKPQSPGERFVEEHRETFSAFHRASHSAQSVKEFSQTAGYRTLLVELRAAAVASSIGPRHPEAESILREAAEALGVPVIDLLRLREIPAHIVAGGSWRPRALNVRFLDSNSGSRPVPRGAVQSTLNDLSKCLPGVKTYRLPLLYNFYAEAAEALPILDAAGVSVARALDSLGRIVGGWGESLASDVQRRLWELRGAARGAGLDRRRLRHLAGDEQRMFVMAGKALGHFAADVSDLVATLRGGDTSRRETLMDRLSTRSAPWLHGLGRLLHGLASVVRSATDEDAWRTFAVHLQLGPGLEKWLISTKVGGILMFPTLEQALRDGDANVRVVAKVNVIDTMLAGATISSRGGGFGLRFGPLGASMTNFEHEVKFNLPGVFGLSLGEDYAYGPMFCIGYGPKAHGPSAGLPVNVRNGGQLKLYHEALHGLASPTRRLAEAFAKTTEGAERFLADLRSGTTGKLKARRLRGRWPDSEFWLLARRHVHRARAARITALHRLSELEASARTVGDAHRLAERAESSGLSAREAEDFAGIATRYLTELIDRLGRDIVVVEGLAERAGAGQAYSARNLSSSIGRLEARAVAFEFCDVLFQRVLGTVVDVEKPPHNARRRSHKVWGLAPSSLMDLLSTSPKRPIGAPSAAPKESTSKGAPMHKEMSPGPSSFAAKRDLAPRQN